MNIFWVTHVCLLCFIHKALASPSHFVLIWQVAQMLNQHFHSISRHSSPVRPGGWAQGFIPVRHSKQPAQHMLNALEGKVFNLKIKREV